jgi:hypothetical protein
MGNDDIPEEFINYCSICNTYYDVRDLNQVLPHLKHDPNFPQDYKIPDHFITRRKGDNREWLDGKSEINLD